MLAIILVRIYNDTKSAARNSAQKDGKSEPPRAESAAKAEGNGASVLRGCGHGKEREHEEIHMEREISVPL